MWDLSDHQRSVIRGPRAASPLLASTMVSHLLIGWTQRKASVERAQQPFAAHPAPAPATA